MTGSPPAWAHDVDGDRLLDVPLLRLRARRAATRPAELYAAPLRLLSAPEQDVVLRELLHDDPESVVLARRDCARRVGTRGFAREVQAVLARARERGLDPDRTSRALGRAAACPSSRPPACSSSSTSTCSAASSAIDYADLIRARGDRGRPAPRRAAGARSPTSSSTSTRTPTPARSRCCARWPATVATSPWSATPTSRSTASAAPRCAASSTSRPRSRSRDGRPRRSSCAGHHAPLRAPILLAASRRVAGRIAVTGTHPRRGARARSARPRPCRAPHGRRPGRGAHLRHRARRGRARRRPAAPGPPRGRHRLGRDGGAGALGPRVASRRCGARSPPPGCRSRWPATRPRSSASRRCCRCSTRCAWCVDLDDDDPDRPRLRRPRPRRGTAHLAARRARRDRPARPRPRPAAREKARADGAARRPSLDAAAAAPCSSRAPRRASTGAGVAGPGAWPRCSPRGRGARRRRARAEEVLWALWSGTAWPRAAAARRRARRRRGARRAHRDLDAVCALFETAARAEEQRGHVGVAEFLDTLRAQQIPADTLADAGVRGEAVRLLTAHRSKGLEWRLVVVAHVQEGGWPDLRRRGTLLGADRIGRDGLLARRSPARAAGRGAPAVLRRLHPRPPAPGRDRGGVARRRRRAAVALPRTSSASTTPSTVQGRPPRPLSLAGLVAELRAPSPTPTRRAALRDGRRPPAGRARREEVDGRPLVPQRRPVDLVGHPRADAARSSRCATPSGRSRSPPARSSPPALPGAVVPRARGRAARGRAPVRQLRQDRPRPRRARGRRRAAGRGRPDDGRRSRRSGTGSPSARRGRASASRRGSARPWAASSSGTSTTRARCSAPSSASERRAVDGRPVVLTGFADRLEIDDSGRVVVVDFKTARAAPSGPSVAGNLQLGALPVRRRRGRPRRGGRSRHGVGRRRARAARHRRRHPERQGPGPAGPGPGR